MEYIYAGTNTTPTIWLIDDDVFSNQIVDLTVKKYKNHVEVRSFTNSEVGLEHIITKMPENPDTDVIVVLLDINMPVLSGWDFLIEFEKLNTVRRNQFAIYILSASINIEDMKRAKKHKSVKGFIIKPLKLEDIVEILSHQKIE